MALALISVIAVAALAAALVLLRARNDLQRRLAAARDEASTAAAGLATVTAERDELRDRERRAAEAAEHARDDALHERERADELSVLLDAATASSATDAEAAAARRGLWHLLLAHVTRRWAAVVGVPPDNRSVVDAAPAAQLAQALARETERLREEVGVDVELNADGSPATGGVPYPGPGEPDGAGAGEPPSPGAEGDVAVLVAALELLGVLASSAQRVTVDVGDVLVLTGDGWLDPYGELTTAYDRAVAAGVSLSPLDLGPEKVRLTVHHTPG